MQRITMPGVSGRLLSAVCLVTVLIMCAGCGRGEKVMSSAKVQKPAVLSEEQLGKVRSLRVLFGHQSVGMNLIDGLNDLAAGLTIVPADSLNSRTGAAFAHFPVGSNTRPETKIASFSESLARNRGGIDVAFFKFCYVDAGRDTDPQALFQSYQQAMAGLKKQYPEVTFIHITMPLMALDGGLRGFINKVRGRSVGEEANAVRTGYNNLLRKAYAGREPLFDLAAVESTAPDGSRVQGVKNGAAYEALCPLYTYDGGHLNESGRKRCAQALLHSLAEAADFTKAHK